MKLLYAVQATGNGHITRARAMLPALQRAGIEIDFLFSGREKDRLFDMQCFGDFQHYQGFTFITADGKVQSWKTLKQAKLKQFWSDVNNLDLSRYDLLLNDFEPVSAWAARRQRIPSIGLAHQYALRYALPGTEKSFWLKPAIDFFTPLDRYLGVHWHHFDQAILPPLLSLSNRHSVGDEGDKQAFILVYLPFESLDKVVQWLQRFPCTQFKIYADIVEARSLGHIQIHPLCRQAFPRDLKLCQGVISNTGFGLSSEALMLGKKLLTKPLAGQIEQYSNACILKQMGKAQVMHSLDANKLENWLTQASITPTHYPNVAEHIAQWLVSGEDSRAEALVKTVWQEVN